MKLQRDNALVFLLVGLALVFVSGIGYFYYQNQQSSATPDSNMTNWKTYTNEKYNFSLKYPDTWNKGSQEMQGENVDILTPLSAEQIGQQIQQVSISTSANSEYATSRDYYDKVIKPFQEGSPCTNPSINATVPSSLKDLDVVIVEGLCGVLNEGPRMIVTKDNYIVVISSSFTDEVDSELIYQILTTFEFLQ